MNYSKMMILLLLFAVATGVQSKSIFLSETGDDSKDGSTSDNAVASITKAFSLLADGDSIVVAGTIDLTKTPGYLTDGNSFNIPDAMQGWTKGYAIIGTDKTTSKFDGGKQGRFGNQIAGYNNANCVITFQNLTFSNLGKSGLGGGSVLRVINNGGKIVVNNCDFTGTVGNEGSIYSDNSNIEIKNCRFYENTVQQGNAVYFAGDASTRSVLIDNCIVENNDCSAVAASSGGAFYINNNSTEITVKNSIIRNNTVTGDGAAFALYTDLAKTEATAVASKLRVENTLIANNAANNGSAFVIKNAGEYFPTQVSVINTTVYKNESKKYGAFFVQEGCTGSYLNLVNSTVIENRSQGLPTDGPGMYITANTNMFKRFYNTIIEGNMPSAAITRDIWFTGIPTEGVDLEMRNSYISFVYWGAGNNPYATNAYGNVLNYTTAKKAMLIEPSADYIASRSCVPLDFESPALKAGDAQYLQALGINTDQEGTIRPFTNGKCAVGAVESFVVPNPIEGEEHNYTHYIISGQSLSTGHQSDPLSTTNVPGNYMLGDRVWVNPENGGQKYNDFLSPLVATASPASQAETPLHGAVNHLRHKMPLTVDADGRENRILATSVGTSGRSIEELSKESQWPANAYRYEDFLKGIRAAKTQIMRRKSTINCPAIIFMQGEWNYFENSNGLTPGSEATRDKDEYKDLFIKLKNNMQTDVMAQYEQTNKPTFYTYQTGAQYTRGWTLEIGMAQLEASNENDDVVMVGPVYPYPDTGGHLDANGYRWYGEMIGKVIYKTQVLGEKFAPLQPVKISRVPGNPKQVKIQYHVPVPPLVFDTHTLPKIQDYGFFLFDNAFPTKKKITNIEIDGDCVILTSETNLNGKIVISYAGWNTIASSPSIPNPEANGNGNLRDSDDYGSFFKYVDRQWTGDNYTRSDHPRNEQGEIIYDQLYPLYNFGVAYYYEVPNGVDEYVVPNAPGNEEGNRNSITADSKNSTMLWQAGSDLHLNTADEGVVKLDIYSISGHLAKSYTSKTVPESTQTYSLSNLAQGVYIAKAKIGNNLYLAKIILK